MVEDKGNVIIENDVWVGQNVTIMPGVCIGSGSIIANNSHVIKSCPPYSIIGGNPAKIIKKRFSESQIEKLLENIIQKASHIDLFHYHHSKHAYSA